MLQGLLLISSIHLLAAASPGPDFVLVSQQTLLHGKKAGLLCSLGITLGLSVHILYSAFGLAALLANSENALWLIKILGGGYLLYLGIKGLSAKASLNTPLSPDVKTQNETTKISTAKNIGKGFLCNALNPKAPIYFVALFTIVLSPTMPGIQIAIYGLCMMLIQFAWFSTVVLLLSRPSINAQFSKLGHWLDRILGSAMIALALKILLTQNISLL